jgi:hypothetical protein
MVQLPRTGGRPRATERVHLDQRTTSSTEAITTTIDDGISASSQVRARDPPLDDRSIDDQPDGVATHAAVERTTDDATGDGGGGAMDTDTIFHTLSNRRRRYVLAALCETDRMTVRELTTTVAAAEYECPPEALDYKQRKRVYTALVQTHLPSMARRGVVDYDKDRGIVAVTTATGTFEPYLDGGATIARAWAWNLLSLAGVFAALIVLLAVDAPYTSALSATGVALAATVGLGALAVAYARRGRNAERTVEIHESDARRPSLHDAAKRLTFFWR